MEKLQEKLVLTVIVVTILSVVVGLQIFSYKECKKVGHSTFYCVFLGK